MLLNNENNFLHLAKKIIKIIMKKIILIFVLVFIFDIACAKNGHFICLQHSKNLVLTHLNFNIRLKY